MNGSPVPATPKSARPSDLEGVWHIGASAPLQAALDAPTCPPAVRQALQTTLTWQHRCETPMRKTLAAPGVAPQLVAALLACGATASVEMEGSATELPLEMLLEQGKGGRALVLSIPVAGPISSSGELRWGEAHVTRAPSDEPIVAAWAVVELDGASVRRARVALTGVWAEPARLARAAERLAGGPLDEARIQAAAAATALEVAPQGDYLGSVEYRKAMAGVVTRRALLACLRHLGGRDE